MRKAHNRKELDVDYIVREYKSGRSAIAIGEELGVHKKTILTRLREQGVARRKANTFPELTTEFLNKEYVDNKRSSRDIAAELGCSSNLVIKRLRQFNIPRRKHAGDESFTEVERKEKWGRPRELHNLWKGGVTGVNETLRFSTSEWRKDILNRAGYQCVITGETSGSMHVHHVKPFYKIRDEMMENLGLNIRDDISEYTISEVELMRKTMKSLHEQEKGFVMKKEIHLLFHRLYGYDTDEDDVGNFRTRYINGEFNDMRDVS